MGKIDEILSWEKSKEQEKDTRFVELGEYLCEVRSKQYWRVEKLKSFDEFLEKRFPGIAPQGLLPDGHSRESDASTETATSRSAGAKQ